jgi:hypothetical protein
MKIFPLVTEHYYTSVNFCSPHSRFTLQRRRRGNNWSEKSDSNGGRKQPGMGGGAIYCGTQWVAISVSLHCFSFWAWSYFTHFTCYMANHIFVIETLMSGTTGFSSQEGYFPLPSHPDQLWGQPCLITKLLGVNFLGAKQLKYEAVYYHLVVRSVCPVPHISSWCGV